MTFIERLQRTFRMEKRSIKSDIDNFITVQLDKPQLEFYKTNMESHVESLALLADKVFQNDLDVRDERSALLDSIDKEKRSVVEKLMEILRLIKTLAPPITKNEPEAPAKLNYINLSKITLPKFIGNIEDWQAFWDQFSAAIDSHDGLSKTHKFRYLKSSLTGKASSLIKALNIKDNNYLVAINILKSRYDNKREVI